MMNYTATPPVVPMNCASNPTMASLSTFSPPPPLPYFDRSSLPLPPSLSTSHSFSVRIPRGSINTPVLPSSTGPPTSSFPALPSHPLPAPSYPPLPPLPLPLPSASSTYSSSRPQLESAVPLGYLDPPPSDRNDTAVDLHPSRRSTRKRTRTIENEKEEVELEEEEGEDELVKKKRAVRSGKGKGKGKGAGGRKNSAKRSTSQQEGTSEKPKSTKKFKTDRNADNADGHVQEGDEEDEDVDEDDGYEMSEGRKMEEEARVRKLRDEGSVRERWVKYAAAILVAKEGGGDPAEARNYLGSLIERIGSSSTLPLDQKQYRSSTFLANLKRLDDCATENLDQGRVGEWKNSSPDAWKDGKPVTNSLPKSMEECDRMSLGNWPPCENPSTCATMEDWVKTKTIQDNAVQLDLLPHMFSVSYTGLPVTEMFYSETGRRLLQERAGAILGYAVENGILLELYGSDVKQMILNSDGFEFTTVELEVEWEGEKPGEEKTCIVETVMARKRGGNEGEGTIVVVLAHPCRGSAGYANVISLRNQDASLFVSNALQPETLEPNPDRHYNEKAYGGNAAPGGRSMMNGITVNKKAGEEFQRGTPLEPFEWGIRLGRLIPTYKNDVSTWSKASAFVKNDPILPNALRNSEVQIAARAIQLRSQETRELRSVPEEERTVEQRIRLETRDRINHERHHSEKEALRTGKYRCTFPGCDIKFKGSEQLKVHRYSHTGAYPYKCDQCVPARGFGYLSEFQAHQSTHTGKWRHQCQELGCDRGFHQFHELEAHQSTHTGKWKYQCQELGCDRGFHQFHELEAHRSTHTGKWRHQCQEQGCDRGFDRRDKFEEHMRTHNAERPYKCPFKTCDKAFTRKGDLTRHARIHEEDPKPHPCPVCLSRFARPDGLLRHYRNTEKGKVCQQRIIENGGLDPLGPSKPSTNPSTSGSSKVSSTPPPLPTLFPALPSASYPMTYASDLPRPPVVSTCSVQQMSPLSQPHQHSNSPYPNPPPPVAHLQTSPMYPSSASGYLYPLPLPVASTSSTGNAPFPISSTSPRQIFPAPFPESAAPSLGAMGGGGGMWGYRQNNRE